MEKEEVNAELNLDEQQIPVEEITKETDLTFRDDQHDYDWIRDILKKVKPRGKRFRLIDSGVFSGHELEALVRMGSDLYTSDRVRKDVLELEFILKAARSRGTLVAAFLHNDIVSEEEHGFIPRVSLANLGRQGLFVHVSNREKERKLEDLSHIGAECRKGHSALVYYHHGPLNPEYARLVEDGIWMHVSNKSIQTEEDFLLFLEMASVARKTGAGCVLYVEEEISLSSLREAVKSPAVVLFKIPPVDFKSSLKPLVDEAKRKRLDYKAFYLYPTFLL